MAVKQKDNTTFVRHIMMYLDQNQVADLLEVDVRTLTNWRSKRVGPPYFKLDGAICYAMDSIFAWVENECMRGNANRCDAQ